jgi:iron complex outermembrane receptor protein
MKKLFLGICYSLITQIVISQSISGRVIDASNGTALPSATVELDNQTVQLSNENGEFSFSKLKPGSHTIKISTIGYKTLDSMVASGTEILIFKVQQWNLFMQPVEVRAIRASDRAPFTKTNVGKKEIEKLNLGQDLPFLLNQTPSVVVNSDAGNGVGYTGIRIRGTDATRINMTINGIPYNDAESQGLFFVNLPDFASSVNNIQIQRGVGTSSNGAGAFGASINFSSNEVITSPYAEINNSYGSFNTWKNTVKAGTGLLAGHFTVDARLSNLTSDGFIDRASSDLSSFYLSGAYLSERTSIRANIISGKERTYQAWNGISDADLENNRTYNSAGTERPGSPYDNEVDNYKQDHYQLFFNHKLNNRVSFNTAFFLTKGKGYYEQYKAEQSFGDYGLSDFVTGGDTLQQTDLIRQLWLDNDYYGQILSVQYKESKNQLTVGGGWNRYDGNHFGEIIWAGAGVPDHYRWYDHEAYKTDVNVYGKYQRKLSQQFEGFVDLQYRHVLYSIDGFRNNPSVKVREIYNFFNPKIGITYVANNYQVYASYSVGQKEPNRDDFEAGDGQIPKPEKLHDIELGVEKKTSNYNWGATIYYMRYKDQLVLSGKINDVGAYTRINIPDSYRLGLELQGRALITNWLNVSANLTLSSNKVNDFVEYYDDYDNGGQKTIEHGTTDIALSPAVVGSAALNLIPFKNMEISLPGKYVSRQYLDNTSDVNRSLNAFYVQDAMISYTIHKLLLKEINLMFQVNNLFDKKYEPNGYTFSYQYGGSLTTENYYFPMAGTNFIVAINLKL